MAKEWARAFYASQAWRTVRQEVLRRDGFTCRDCGGRATEVHHSIELTPHNIGSLSISLNPKLLVSLCHDCHTKITDKANTSAYAELPAPYEWGADGQPSPRGD